MVDMRNRQYAIDKAHKLYAELVGNSIPVDSMYLFGSYAKETATDYSDIDIAIVSPKFSGDRFDDNLLILPFVIKIESRIETHPYSPITFGESPFVRDEILTNGIKIV